MKQIRDDLWQSSITLKDGVNNCAFLLGRPEGNVLLYHTPNEDDLGAIAGLGGVAHQILSHHHEAKPCLNALKERFGSKLCSDALEARAIGEVCPVDLAFDGTHNSLGSLQIIQTPGHTAGGLSCTYRSPHGETYLFSGDLLIPVKGHWITLAIPDQGGSAAGLKESLSVIRDLKPDLVLSSATVGDASVLEVGHAEWLAAVDLNLDRLAESA